MNIACLAFTASGRQIAARIQAAFEGRVEIVSQPDYKARLSRLFDRCDGLVFVSAAGIAVRLCAPLLRDKSRDPAIVVVDDLGRYAISLVSGHLGGANELARQVAAILGGQPIITTASDGRGFEAVDVFAKRHNLVIENMADAKTLTAMMVAGRPIQLIAELELTLNYEHLVETQPEGCVYVTARQQVDCEVPCCLLRPLNLVVGIGCRKGKTRDDVLSAIKTVFREQNLALASIKTLATVEDKQHEPGLIEACTMLGCSLTIFTRDDIRRVQHRFAASAFVQATLGITAVCEPCAALAGGQLIVGKTVVNGVTIAVARRF
jgi:cobalt-precorrin 5A hydrolase